MEFLTRKKLKMAGKMAVNQAVDGILDEKHLIVPMYNHMFRFHPQHHVKEVTPEIYDTVSTSINKLAQKMIDAIELTPTKNMRVNNDNFVIIYHPYKAINGAHVVIEYRGHISYGNLKYSQLYEKEK